MTQQSDHYVKAHKLFERFIKEIPPTTIGGVIWSEFAEKVAAVLHEEQPSPAVLAPTCWLVRAYHAPGWSQELSGALDHALQIRLVKDQITVQLKLAQSNDRLGAKMFWVSIVGVLVATVGAAATIIPLWR